jgi:hypothetical protein
MANSTSYRRHVVDVVTLRFGVGSLVIATTVGIAYISAVLALVVHALIAGYYMAELRRPPAPGASGV